MSLIGPRPLLVQYLPLYSEKQKHRHDVRPGLSGYAQVNGRNSISWTHKFELDCEYVEKITFLYSQCEGEVPLRQYYFQPGIPPGIKGII